MNKVIIFSAPSGSGKSTIINYLLTLDLGLEFSISATSRAPRGEEKDGIEYYFLSVEDFKNKISEDAFVEFEEVYENGFYGTFKSEVDRISAKGNITIFDVDVKGGVNLKKYFGEQALSLFIQPPSVEELRKRLTNRATDAPDKIDQRVAKAAFEMTFAPQFDKVILNDEIEVARNEAAEVIREFLSKN